MVRRRSRAEIILDILEAVEGEPMVTPTRLATITNMPYDRLAPIVEHLQSRGVIEAVEDGRTRRLVLTRRGYKLLQELRRLKRILRDFGLDLL